ncbi:myosin heavy chain 9/10/11/14, partial [Pancytospora epiphaga]
MVHTGGTNQKKWVWVPCEKELYKPAYVLEEVNSRVKVQGDTVEEHQAVAVFRMNPPKFDQAENLSSLSYLNEPSVLHNIQTRYRDSLVYTYSGLFLLAVNPYRNMNIYSNEIKKKIIKEKRGESAPHIFSVANEAYRAMIANKENQSILITGESGAGKTENTKKVIEFLAFAASAGNEEFTASNNIENALMSANPLLEAFGNAKTVKNDNSSRFGKFVQVKFKEGKICGAKIEKYLLEKSRVMGTPAEERNFHIFYYLLAGASQELLSELFLVSNPSFYECLRNTQHKIHGVDDRKQFESLSQAFEELGISDPTPYYKTVAAILHISNVKVVEVNDRAVIDASNDGYRPIEIASDLLNVSCVDFINAVVNPVLKAGNELVVHYRTKEQAVSILEGFAKMLYESLFDVLISEINRQLDSTFDNYIGILDIAGFEIFKINSFEQLCINYTNEKLQQYFNHHMFILEQEIYKNEEIDWNFIDFGLDLEPTIRTIESSNPIGVLSYLDEECVMPCATDKTLLEKLRLVKGVDSPPFKDSFAIKHYAGKVEYEVNNWLRKNKDAESEALLLLVSENKRAGKGENTQFIKKGSFKTVAQSHREGLRWLMDTLKGTQPHFVRCILPNLLKTSDNFNKRLVLDQLRCNGVLEGIRISRLGYPTRIAFNEFNDRYGFIGGIEKEEDAILPKERSISLINRLMLNKNGYRVGRTMVFFRQGVIADLEDLRERRMTKLAGVVQEMVRIKIAVKKESLDKDRLEAIRHLQRNAGLSVKLLKWKWWYLFLKVQPLLDVKRAENDKKKLQEQIDLRREALEKVEKEKEEKEKENGRLQMMLEALRAELSRKESELMDKEGLLESLRNDNSRISSYVAALKESEESIGILKESLSQLSSKNEANVEMKKELERQHAILKEEFEKKKNELDLMISQDLGNVLCSKEEELGELRRKLVNAEKRCCEVSKQNENLSASVDRKNKECEMLNENEMKQEIE